MPKIKKKYNRRQFIHPHITYHNRVNSGLMLVDKNNASMPPMIFEPEDFTKDILDVGECSNNITNATSSNLSNVTSMVSKTTTAATTTISTTTTTTTATSTTTVTITTTATSTTTPITPTIAPTITPIITLTTHISPTTTPISPTTTVTPTIIATTTATTTTPTTTATTTTTINSTTTTAPKIIGRKIPVNMREDIVRNGGIGQNIATIGNKKGQLQLNQLLKDCLSSDIKTVVQDNIKSNLSGPQMSNIVVRTPVQMPHTPQIMQFSNLPRGVPRSFLTRANQTVIEPQLPGPEPTVRTNFVPTIHMPMFNLPISHAGIPEVTYAPTMQSSEQICQNTQTFVKNTRYSPTDLYSDLGEENKNIRQGERDGPPSPENWQSGEKRVSAFERLGPLAQPKTPKLTINLSFNKEQAVREVVDKSPLPSPPAKVYIPVHEREDILQSTDETVMKYVDIWPWAKPLCLKRTVKGRGYQPTNAGKDSSSVGYSPTAMMMLKEQMDENYQRNNSFIAVSITGYPSTWTKEDVLDAMLDNLKEKSFVPCFIEFNDEECKFLVIRCREALLAIHALDFHIQKDDVQLSISISQIALTVLQLDFIPRLILRKRLAMIHCNRTKLNLSAFTLQPDISHFIYYPLNHFINQLELSKLQTDLIWSNLTELDLSHNRLTTVEGFDLVKRMPKLHHLDLSHNYLEKATMLLCCRNMSLRSLKLEGNPLCHDYIDPQHYVTVLKMMFPSLRVLDDVPICMAGDTPVTHRNYCIHGAAPVIDNFLQLYVPLLDSHADERVLLSNMYTEDAYVTITYRPKIDYEAEFRYPRTLLLLSRVLLEGTRDFADGKSDIEELLRRWPNFEHDPTSLTVDVMFHSNTSTIFRLDGIVKLPADTLAENDLLLAFSRTIHLHTSNGVEYKIANEMIYWDKPTEESSRAAFRRSLVKKTRLSFKFESPPDDDCKKKLISTFMTLTHLEEQLSIRCLKLKNWDFKEALEYFMKLYKVDNLVFKES